MNNNIKYKIISCKIIPLVLYNNKILNFFTMKYKFTDTTKLFKYICINKYNLKNITCNNNKYLDFYTEKILNSVNILLTESNYSKYYTYLIYGLYNLNIENIIELLNLLSLDEYNKLINEDINEIFNCFTINNKNEYVQIKNKLLFLRNIIIPQITHRINIKNNSNDIKDIFNINILLKNNEKYDNKTIFLKTINNFEKILNINSNDYELLDRLYPLIETIEYNDIEYKNIYYVVLLKKNINNTLNLKKSLSLFNNNHLINNIKTFIIYNSRYFEKYYFNKFL